LKAVFGGGEGGEKIKRWPRKKPIKRNQPVRKVLVVKLKKGGGKICDVLGNAHCGGEDHYTGWRSRGSNTHVRSRAEEFEKKKVKPEVPKWVRDMSTKEEEREKEGR